MARKVAEKIEEFDRLGRNLARARANRGLTQKGLAESSGLSQSDISKIEAGERSPTPLQLARFARELGVALQWFLSGDNRPGSDLCDLALELRHLGVVDLWVPDARAPGAFRPAEQVVACAVSGDVPDTRVVEALPAVLAWNAWDERLLTAYARACDPRAPSRLAWLADVALTAHKGQRFPGGIVDSRSLSHLVRRTRVRREPDDLGRPATDQRALPPVSRRWNVLYAADLSSFVARASHLHSLRHEETSHD